MKSKTKSQTKTGGISLLEVAFFVLPLLALIPNFFIIPDLTYPGLATQEVAFSVATVIFAAIGLIELIRTKTNLLSLPREHVILIGSLLAFILWQVVSLKWSPVAYDGVRIIGIWFGFAVFFVVGLTVMRQQAAEILHYVLTAIAALLAASLLYERAAYGENMLGIFFNHGITSEVLVTLLPLQIMNYLCSRKTMPMFISLAAAGLSLLALLVGLRRGAVLATIVVFVLIGIGLAMKQIKLADSKRLIVIAAVFVVAATFVGVRYREQIAFRIQGATQLSAVEGGLTNRLRGWITAWEMGKRNAVIGVGQAGYPAKYGEYRRYFTTDPRYASVVQGYSAAVPGHAAEDTDEIRSPLVHNEYLEIFVELGVIGLLLFAAFWLQLGRRLWQWSKLNPENAHWIFGGLLGMIAFSISSAFSSFSFRYTPTVIFVACLFSIAFGFAKGLASADDEQPTSVSLPKIAALASVVVALIICLAFTARAYNVYVSQVLQGQATLRTEKLDFNFSPDKPADNERLERRYKQVLELDSANTGAHFGYGLLLFQMRRPAEAIPHLELGVNGGYNHSFGYIALAFAHEQAGNLAKATELMRECVIAYPQSIFGHAVYAELLTKSGQTAEADKVKDVMMAKNAYDYQSWELALRTKAENAVAEATSKGVIPLDKLQPQLAARLVFWRAFHYLK
ncbi:MAG: O-antigen ligase family protein [Acidobacteria bacterium]|nr:O-antigen ligase family protein [Acidobacteriota bacterium]